ncbi:MAG: glycosyltransferase family 1 protein [Lentisphaeria bacterium]|nr:glycosyltransferase family 1 protein [Lentisphaeria bacterium]
MRQLHVAIDGLLVRKGVSGVETTIYGLGQAAAAYGSLRYSFFMRKSSPLPDARGKNIRTVRCAVPFNWKLFRLFQQRVLLPGKVDRSAFDVSHHPGYVAPRRGKTPRVVTIHDALVYSHPELCRASTVAHYRFCLPRTVNSAAVIVVPSRSARQALIDFFPDAADKTRVVPWAVDERFQPRAAAGERDRLRAAYRLPERFLLFVGQIEPKKNLPGLLNIFKTLRQNGVTSRDLVIAGGRGWERVDLRQRARELGIMDHVHLLGFVPSADLPALYRAADICVFPSLCEGFGLPPLEAMACGTPAMVSDQGALPEVVGETMPARPPDDIAGWADELTIMIRDDAERGRLAEAGVKRAARFTWADHMASMDAVYRAAAERKT